MNETLSAATFALPAAPNEVASVAIHGFLFGFSLLVAIGPQNAYLLKMSLKRQHVGLLVVICAISDVILILAGTAGIGVILEKMPLLLTVLIWGGFVYLLYFAFTCFRDAFRNQALTASTATAQDSPAQQYEKAVKSGASNRPAWVTPALTVLALTWLNPGAYIDTVVMIGGLANQNEGALRWVYAAGAITASFVWFPTLGFGARALSGPLSSPRTWQILNFAIGVIMVAIAIRLVVS